LGSSINASKQVLNEFYQQLANMTGNNPSSEGQHVEIYTDGGCEPNPGPGGYGAVLIHPKTTKRKETSGGFRKTTNNRMEIFAAIAGLDMLKQPCKVTVFSDSQYVVKAMMEGWVAAWKRKGWWRTKTERPENVDLWQRLDALCQTHQVEFRWVKGHAGNPENERCDQLAMAALRQPNLPVDDGYENKPETEGVRPDMQEGEPCRKCSTPVIKRTGKWKPTHDYYYEFHLICPNCQTTYHVESAKRTVEQPPSLF
jgi:ribonuclease HI